MFSRTALILALAATALAATALAAAPRDDTPMPGDWRIVGGRVDRGTFNGWRIFHSACHGCHGVGGAGTDIAPNLLQRVPEMTPRDFASKVLTSYRLVSPALDPEDQARERAAQLDEVMRRERGAGRAKLLMPAWESDAAVPPHVLDLYAYLSARAAGELGPGRPVPMAAKRRR